MNTGRIVKFCRLTFLFLLLQCAIIRADPPAITLISPSAIPNAGILPVPQPQQHGQEARVTFHGSNLDQITSIWTSFPCQTEFKTTADAKKLEALFLPSKEINWGIGAIRLVSIHGASNLQFVMLDDLPTITENGLNKSLVNAQILKIPTAVEGHCDPLVSRFFKFAAKRDQRLSFDVVAQRLGSRLDSLVRLLDSTGREISYCDDDPAAGTDSRFTCRIPGDGDYFIELRDTNYEGGPAYRYRLRLGDFPLRELPFVGNTINLTSNILPACPETEPNDTPETATPLKLPARISGQFDYAHDRDHFKFEAAKGTKLSFTSHTRSLGSPCDVFMRVTRLNGTLLVQQKPTNDEGSFEVTFPDGANYLLVVEELNRQGGAGMTYRIDAGRARPDFTLSVEEEKADRWPNGAFQLKVNCTRRDYKGPVTLSINGAKMAVENNIIATDKKETVIKINVPADFRPGKLVHFSITGTAKIGDENFTTTASTIPALKKLFPSMLYPPIELDGQIAVGVMEKKP